MFYQAQLRQSEIAPRLGVTKGPLSQIHSQAISELRHVLAGLDGVLPSPKDMA